MNLIDLADYPDPALEEFREPCSICIDCDVRKMAVCAALESKDLGALEEIMSSRKLTTNEILIEAGEPKQRVYTLTSGMLRLFTMLPDGRRQISSFLFPGDYLGLADDDTYSLSAEAVCPSALCSFKVNEMDALMARFPELKDRLYFMTKSTLRQSQESQLVLGRLAPVEKLASFLLLLSANQFRVAGVSTPVSLPMNRTDIADYLGLTVETVSRSFTRLRSQGLIHLPESNVVAILSHRLLTDVAGTCFQH